MHPRREHEPGDESRRADQHGEGVVIEIAGLQAHHVAGDVEDAGGNAVGPEAVDQPAVAASLFAASAKGRIFLPASYTSCASSASSTSSISSASSTSSLSFASLLQPAAPLFIDT